MPPNESPEDVARREAVEEAGCVVAEIEAIGEFYLSPGTSVERISLYCGRVRAPAGGTVHGLDHEGEDIRVEVLAADAAIAELFAGRVNSTTSIVTLQWLAAHRADLRVRWRGSPAGRA